MSYRWLGTYHAWRTRGRETLQSIEPWVKIAVLGAPAAHYLGLSSGWSVMVGVGIVLGAEIAMLVLGAFDYRNGVLESQQRLLNAQDPFKMAVLDFLRRYQQGNGYRVTVPDFTLKEPVPATPPYLRGNYELPVEDR